MPASEITCQNQYLAFQSTRLANIQELQALLVAAPTNQSMHHQDRLLFGQRIEAGLSSLNPTIAGPTQLFVPTSAIL